MAFKPPAAQPDFSSLITSLDNSKIQSSNYALYQTLFFLIHNTQNSRNLLLNDIGNIGGDLSKVLAATLLTEEDETIIFPNSRRLLAGLGITLDITVPNQMTISSVGGIGDYYDTPLTDGDLDETDLIFALGECIIVQVPI